MFGFLRPQRSFILYRKAYARCCQIQKKSFGISTLPALSYEAVSLYLMCIDAKVVDALSASEPNCCRLRVRQDTIKNDVNRIGEYCVSTGVLLLETKIQDDIRDTHSIFPRFLSFWLRKKFRKAHSRLLSADPHVLNSIENHIETHLILEKWRNAELAEYTIPTAKAFAELFAAVTNFFPVDQLHFKNSFSVIGYAIGQALIAFDCAADWWKDARRGDFNPVTSFTEADHALVFAADQLAKAGQKCRVAFGSESLTSQLLVTRSQSLLGKLSTPSTCRSGLEKAGFTREPGFTYAYCDGCDCDCSGCDGCCDIGDCSADGGCCDSGDPNSDLGLAACLLPADCCCCCYEPACCGPSKPTQVVDPHKKSEQNDKAPEIVGQSGKTITPLSPSGIISINNERHPATAAHGYIEADVDVVVSNVAPYGLIVERLESEN